MKKTASILLALMMIMLLCACGKSEAAKMVDDMIEQIGVVTLESSTAIEAAEQAYEALTPEQKEELDNYAILVTASATLDALIEEKENKEAAAQIDEKIAAIGTVSLESGALVEEAVKAYDAANDAIKEYVEKAAELEGAKEKYRALKIENTVSLITNIGEVTLQSAEAIDAAAAAYDSLSDDERSEVGNADVLEQAKQAYETLQQAEKARLLGNMRKVDDPVRNLQFYYPYAFPYYSSMGYWGADVRCFALPYLGVKGDDMWMRLVCDYTSDDWVFFEKITFAVDDERYYKTFGYFDVERDNEYGDVWEYVDIEVGDSELEMLEAIANSTTTIVRFEGSDYYRDFTISDSDKAAIREVVAVYKMAK